MKESNKQSNFVNREMLFSLTERHEQIIELLEQKRRITVDEICEHLDVSVATARRDLKLLAEAGKLQRVHGGAIAKRQTFSTGADSGNEPSISQGQANSGSKNVLVFAPHFDDESIACGGAIARHVAKGDRVVVVFMTRGDSGSTIPGHEMDSKTSERILKAESEAAAKVLGIARCVHLDLDDGFLCWDPEVVREIVRLINRYRPTIVYAPHADEGHSDHRATHLMVNDAVPRAGWGVFPSLIDEPWTVEEVRYYEMWTPMLKPNLYIDISRYVEQKLLAIRCYASQMVVVPYDEAAIGLNRFRGATTAKYRYAEAFLQWSVINKS